MQGSNLQDTDLTEAQIIDADFRGANLLNAKLPEYKNIDLPKLDGAIMPDGTIYKDDSSK